ncbi:MAG: hypothetical protein KC586_16915 [Myxococcales bacterium]|nr:hypothetical protein [Myxococcales bacterium]
MTSILSTALAGILLLPGCGEPGQACASQHVVRERIAPGETASFVDFDGVRVEIDETVDFETSIGASGMRHFVSGCELEVRAGELVLDGRRYGAVREGDRVLVRPDGITINGVLRAPSIGD